MAKNLFSDFLENVNSYRSSESTWAKTVEDLATGLGQKGEWYRWIPRHFADGTPMELEGNPIFDGRSSRLDRAFTIIQHAPIGEGLDLVVWMNSHEPEFAHLPRFDLVLGLSLSEESLAEAREILKMWMSPETTAESMKARLKAKSLWGGPD